MSQGTSQWAPGAEVVKRSSGFGRPRYGERLKIGKVYANGNFILEGDASRTQWRPMGDVASQRGGDRWSRTYLVIVTPDLEAEIATARQVEHAKAAVNQEIERLREIARSGDDEAILDAYAAISKASRAEDEQE